MIYVIARSVLKPGKRDEFLKIFKANVPNVLAESGCISYTPCIDVEIGRGTDENSVTIVECWESPAHLKAHLATPHMKQFGPSVKSMRSSSSFHVLEDVLP